MDNLQAEFETSEAMVEVRDDVTDSPSSILILLSDDVTTTGVPRDVTAAAVLPTNNVDYHPADVLRDISPVIGESLYFQTLELITPELEDVIPIPVYNSCIDGTCDCRHFIGDVPAQLKPCRAAQFLFGPNALPSIDNEDRDFLWHGLVNGFRIVDSDCPASYQCQNYESITSIEFKEEMSALLLTELASHKVSRATTAPTCIHALGAVKKSDGRLRPITDCSRPDGSSINNFMTTTFRSFSYNSVDTAVQVLSPGDHMSVVDISSAYRTVSVHADHTSFQGFTWDFGEGEEVLRDNRLCFGLRCAPNIFDSLSSFIVKIANSKGAYRVINYLDDFLVMEGSAQACLQSRDIVTSVITLLGFDVSWKKVTQASQVTTFLGITIDSVNME